MKPGECPLFLYFFISNLEILRGTITRGYNLVGKFSLPRASAADEVGSYGDYYKVRNDKAYLFELMKSLLVS